MTAIFRARTDLLREVHADLRRPHSFAAERVGFLLCKAGRLSEDGMVILATAYHPVEDNDYLNDLSVGAMMGPAAIRKAMQRAYNGGAQDISLFHVHIHEHKGLPGFSRIDIKEASKFVPAFFNAVPAMPHGIVVLSMDKAAGLYWHQQTGKASPINRFSIIGAPLRFWSGRP